MRDFGILWSGQLVSIIGSALTAFALGVWIYQKDASLSQYAFFSTIPLLPPLLIMPFAGAVIDRVNRRHAVLATDLGAALGPLAILIASLSGELKLWHVYVGMLVTAAFSSAQIAAVTAASAQLVPPEKLLRASGLTELSGAVPQVLGPLLAGVFLSTFGVRGVVVVDLLTFAVGLGATFLVTVPDLPRRERGASLSMGSLLADNLEAARYIRADGALGRFLGLVVLVGFLVAIGRVVFIPYILTFASPTALGGYLGLGGGAMIAASIAVSRASEPRSLRAAIGLSIIAMGLGIALLAIRTSRVAFCVGVVVLYAGISTCFAYSRALLQREVDGALLGRVLSLRGFLSTLATIGAYLLAGPLVDRAVLPFIDGSDTFRRLLITTWITGPEKGIAMGYILLAVGALVVPCGAMLLTGQRFGRLDREGI